MKKNGKIYLLLFSIACLCVSDLAYAQTAPPPLRNVQIQARVVFDDAGRYNYFYTVTNPAENTLGISQVAVAIVTPPDGMQLPDLYAPLPPGYKKPFGGQLKIAKRESIRVIPFYVLPLPGWDTNGLTFEYELLGSPVSAVWRRWRESAPPIMPGQTLGEFQLASYGLPGIRNIVARPRIGDLDLPDDWATSEDDTDEQIEEKRRKQESLGCLMKTIGATAPPAAFVPVQFNQRILDYINQSAALQWLKDANLAQQLRTLLTQNDHALKEERYTDAQALLTQFQALVRNATPLQRTSEAEGLVYYNAKYLYERIIDYIPTALEMTPLTAAHPINEIHEGKVLVTQGTLPRQGYPLNAMVVSGPHAGLGWWGSSNEQGIWSFSYKGEKVGTDKIALLCMLSALSEDDYCYEENSAPVYVTWEGGPDLMLDNLFPPVIQLPSPNSAIPLKESTVNIGTLSAPAGKTRLYLSKDQQLGVTTIVLGQRDVPALNVNEVSEYQADIPVPQNLDPGLYWLIGCADADNQIAELNEQNNCQTRIIRMFGLVKPMDNRPPDCSNAQASEEFLWPPNHKFRTISIEGVTDPDNDPITLTSTSISQDEPLNGLGDGDTSPDGILQPLQVRAERSGAGNGRVYTIGFTATDSKGGACNGTVSVCVPHDQGTGKNCTNDGPIYDSTLQ